MCSNVEKYMEIESINITSGKKLKFHVSYNSLIVLMPQHGSAKATKIESSYLNEIPLQMSPKGMWGPENMKIKNFRWGLFEFYIFLY